MRNIPMLAFLAVLGLVACSQSQTAGVNSTVTASLATAQTDLTNAIAFYQTAKGIALVAEAAKPSIAPQVTQITAVLDPLVITAQAALASATSTAASLEALVSQLQSQAAALEQVGAPFIKAVSSAKA